MQEQKVIAVEMNELPQPSGWGAIVARVIHSVRQALWDGRSPVVQIPQRFYDDFLAGWACAYFPPVAQPRDRWIDKVLRWLGFTVAEREVTLHMSRDALEELYEGMIENRAIVVDGAYVPVVQLMADGENVNSETKQKEREMDTMTIQEFEQEYADRMGVPVEWLQGIGRVALPCHCGEKGCVGWQMRGLDTLTAYDLQFIPESHRTKAERLLRWKRGET